MSDYEEILMNLINGDAYLAKAENGSTLKEGTLVSVLIDALNRATIEFEEDNQFDGRRGCNMAFAAVYGFVKVLLPVIEQNDLNRPLSKLGNALLSLECGQTSGNFFKPQDKKKVAENELSKFKIFAAHWPHLFQY